MAVCRVCGQTFQWGFCDGRWVPLEPIASHSGMDRSYVDEHGEYRADHRDRHGLASVNVMRLEHKVKSTEVLEFEHDEDVVETIGEAQDALADEKGWFVRMRGKVTKN